MHMQHSSKCRNGLCLKKRRHNSHAMRPTHAICVDHKNEMALDMCASGTPIMFASDKHACWQLLSLLKGFITLIPLHPATMCLLVIPDVCCTACNRAAVKSYYLVVLMNLTDLESN